MTINPIQRKGYELLHEGVIELARIEANGIRIDVPRLANTKATLGREMAKIKNRLQGSPEWRMWCKRFGQKANLSSHPQLRWLLYDALKFNPSSYTKTGSASTDAESLMKIELPFAQDLASYFKFDKALGTFVTGIERETINGFLHPVFNLHLVKTFRSSSDTPNFQNFPVRDKVIADIIRSLFIAREGNVIVENDFKGIEVNVSACYHHDKNFIKYITVGDMHGDMAQQIYMVKPDQMTKQGFADARYGAKNKFVFPQFYGDFYVACARNLWEWIEKGKLTLANGTSLYEHLKTQGIRKLGACDPEEDPVEGTFEYHLQEVEDDFWNNRFRDYGQWRKDWYRSYLDKGYFDMHTGFRVAGAFKRNQVTNAPIQGSAFHCLLWTIIQVGQELRKYRMKTKLVGQIHDSLIADAPVNELANYLEIVEDVTANRLRKHWDWIKVPMKIEYEIAPPDGSWHDKQSVDFSKGIFYDRENKRQTKDAETFIQILKKKNAV